MKVEQIISKWAHPYRTPAGRLLHGMAQVIIKVEGKLVTRHVQLDKDEDVQIPEE